MKKHIFGLFLLSLSHVAFAGEPLPTPAGKLEDAKIELCDGSKQDEISEKYVDTIFEIKGVNGFGGHSVSLPEKNIFKIRCAVISVYADEDQIDQIRLQVGETLDGMLVDYVAADPGVAQ